MTNGKQTRSHRRLLLAILLAIGCSGGLDGGCGDGCGDGGGCAPIPGGFQGTKTNNAITAKISQQGFQFFEQNLTTLVEQFVGQELAFDVPCTEAGDGVTICDLNGDKACTAADENHSSRASGTCRANADIRSVSITPEADPNGGVIVNVSVRIFLKTGRIPVRAEVFGIGDTCDIDFDSGRRSPDTIPFDVGLKLSVDPAWGNILAIDVGEIDIVDAIDMNDLRIRGGFLCDMIDGIVGIGFIQDLVVDFAAGPIEELVAEMTDSIRCRACGEPGPEQCPSMGHVASVCDEETNLCFTDKARGVCPPALLGMETRMDVASALADFGGKAGSLLDLYAVAGGVSTDGRAAVREDKGGLVLGIMGGSEAPLPSSCVPAAYWLPRGDPNPIDYDAEAAEGGFGDYKVGLGVSDIFLDKMFFDAYSSGAICLEVGGENVDLLSSDLFTTFLPSLGVLTNGEDVPLLIALRPRTPPNVVIGKGSTKDDGNGNIVPDDPLLTVVMDSLQLDFYALLEERYTRLFSLTTDLKLPLALEFDPVANTVLPALGSLDTLLTNVTASNSRMLSENPQDLADLIGSLIGMVQPLLGDALSPIELPTVEGIKLSIQAAQGVNKMQGVEGYEHMAIFANIEFDTAAMVSTVHTQARLVDSFVPGKDELFGPDRRDAVALIDAEALGAPRINSQGHEYSWRINGGLWSPWIRQSRFEIRSPVLRLQGRHLIEVRSREIGEPATTDRNPAAIPFAVDYEPPTVRVEYDRETDRVITVAQDRVAADDQLTYAYRVAGGSWTSFGPKSEFRLVQLGEEPSLEVKVRDPAGNEAWAVYGTGGDQVAHRSGLRQETPAGSTDFQGGCSQVGASMTALLGLAALLRRRRYTR